MILVAAELKLAGIECTSLDWAAGKFGTFVHRAVLATRDDAENLLRWAAAHDVTLGDISYPRRSGGAVPTVELAGGRQDHGGGA